MPPVTQFRGQGTARAGRVLVRADHGGIRADRPALALGQVQLGIAGNDQPGPPVRGGGAQRLVPPEPGLDEPEGGLILRCLRCVVLSTGPIPPEVPELGQDMKLDRSWRLRIFPVGLRGTAETIETEIVHL